VEILQNDKNMFFRQKIPPIHYTEYTPYVHKKQEKNNFILQFYLQTLCNFTKKLYFT